MRSPPGLRYDSALSLTAQDLDQLQPGRSLLGRYRVIRVLGKGAMGVVVAARDQFVPRTVAIKLMLAQAWGFGNAVERFLREARAATKLTSENVVQVLDVGRTSNGSPYMVMEHLEGMSMDKLLVQCRMFSVEDAVDFTLQACAVTAEAHESGIVHRDIKPGNLFITQRADGGPLVKLLDFGLSKLQEGDEDEDLSLTDTTGTMGSPSYMSPEQCRSAKYVDHRSDIWALGVTLFQFLSGHMPFETNSKAELFAMILATEPQSLTDVAPWIPDGLEAVIMRCLRKNPDERYQSVAELGTALSAFASERGRIFCQSSRLPVPWPLSPPARTTRRAATRDSIVVAAPDSLDLQQFFGSLPTRSYDIRALSSPDPHATSAVPLLRPPVADRPRRRWVAPFVVLILALGVAGWFGLRGDEVSESSADTVDDRGKHAAGVDSDSAVEDTQPDVAHGPSGDERTAPNNTAPEKTVALDNAAARDGADDSTADGDDGHLEFTVDETADETPGKTTDETTDETADETASDTANARPADADAAKSEAVAKARKNRKKKRSKRRRNKRKKKKTKTKPGQPGPKDPFRTME